MSPAEVARSPRGCAAPSPSGSDRTRGPRRWLLRWLDWIFDNEDRNPRHRPGRVGQVRRRHEDRDDGRRSHQLLREERRQVPQARTLRPHNIAGATKKLRLFHRLISWSGRSSLNYPLGMPMMDIPPALAAGAAVLVKPSEVTPLAMTEIANGWNEIGAPPCSPSSRRRTARPSSTRST